MRTSCMNFAWCSAPGCSTCLLRIGEVTAISSCRCVVTQSCTPLSSANPVRVSMAFSSFSTQARDWWSFNGHFSLIWNVPTSFLFHGVGISVQTGTPFKDPFFLLANYLCLRWIVHSLRECCVAVVCLSCHTGRVRVHIGVTFKMFLDVSTV